MYFSYVSFMENYRQNSIYRWLHIRNFKENRKQFRYNVKKNKNVNNQGISQKIDL